jgi:hypothetical protein
MMLGALSCEQAVFGSHVESRWQISSITALDERKIQVRQDSIQVAV